MILFHGGAPELWKGRTIRPDMAHRRFHDGCAICAAHKRGLSTSIDPATPHGFVYATSDLSYARYYASRFGNGWVYEVDLASDAEPSSEDQFPTWRASSALVRRVVAKRVTLTMDERRDLFVRWGGTDAEFNAMVQSTLGSVPLTWRPPGDKV